MQTVFWVSLIWYFLLNSPVDGQGCIPGQVDSARCLGEAGASRKEGRRVAMGVPGFHLFCRLLCKTLNPALGQGLWTQYG